ncbi:tetratricopeptide repeat protein 24-like isoform X2 [Protopterus annectens]|uniref:tetratricopeptide repeat protein 24-like isoform X2 n=1 Tax=Protopterus annectens TaxID=7888 RepID=UPI001CFBC28A|nr:tetratricopeptide repeat protein 24-like isoform X2 [Protopterus annectens]
MSSTNESVPTVPFFSMRDNLQKFIKAGRKALYDDDNASLALELFKKAYQYSCRIPDAQVQRICLFNLGAAYIAAGKAKKGLKCLVKSKWKDSREHDGDLYFNIANAYDEMKEYFKAVTFYNKAVRTYNIQEISSIADAQIKLSYCYKNTGDLVSAVHTFRLASESYQRAQKAEDATMAMGEAMNCMKQSQHFSRNEMLKVLNECLQLCKQVKNSNIQEKLYNDIGLHYVEMKFFRQAEECFTYSFSSCKRDAVNAQKTAVLLQNLGAVYNALHQYEKSLKCHAEAMEIYGALGKTKSQGHCLYNFAYAYSQLENYNMAAFYYQQALQTFEDIGDFCGQGRVCEGLGATMFYLGNMDQAISCYKQAMNAFKKSKVNSSP